MDVGSHKGEFLQPFPAGAHLLGISDKEGIISVNFSKDLLKGQADAMDEMAWLDALALTVSQFKGVRGIQVRIEGREQAIVEGKEVADFLGHGGLKRQPLAVDESRVMEPGPPRLLNVMAVKEKGVKEIEEVNAFFDRPVNVAEFQMTDNKGNSFEGGMYHSVFDMAAVLKPKDPGVFKEQMPIKVRWKITDKLGRGSEGENVWLLEIKVH